MNIKLVSCMPTPILTIFTPTYNRAHTLPRLFESLKKQTCMDFEWLVVDDGSSDNTKDLFGQWIKSAPGFTITYVAVENGGKNRAINRGISLAEGRYFIILDSDDMLTADAVEFICQKMPEIEDNPNFIGISSKKADMSTGLPIGIDDRRYSEEGYVDCTNLERAAYGLERDMAEVFITDRLRKYEFTVWPGEKFTPEEVIWNQMALDGYKLRWYNKITYLCEYQQGGLSDSTWSLLKNNPMGYAMMWNHRLLFYRNFKKRVNAAMQYNVCCLLGREWKQCFCCNSRWLGIALLPVSLVMSRRRKSQISRQA